MRPSWTSRGRIEPFTDKLPHLVLLISRHLFGAGVIIAEVGYQMCYFSVGDLVSEFYERNRPALVEVVARRKEFVCWQSVFPSGP